MDYNRILTRINNSVLINYGHSPRGVASQFPVSYNEFVSLTASPDGASGYTQIASVSLTSYIIGSSNTNKVFWIAIGY